MSDSTLPTGIRRFIGPDGVVQRVRPAACVWASLPLTSSARWAMDLALGRAGAAAPAERISGA